MSDKPDIITLARRLEAWASALEAMKPQYERLKKHAAGGVCELADALSLPADYAVIVPIARAILDAYDKGRQDAVEAERAQPPVGFAAPGSQVWNGGVTNQAFPSGTGAGPLDTQGGVNNYTDRD